MLPTQGEIMKLTNEQIMQLKSSDILELVRQRSLEEKLLNHSIQTTRRYFKQINLIGKIKLLWQIIK